MPAPDAVYGQANWLRIDHAAGAEGAAILRAADKACTCGAQLEAVIDTKPEVSDIRSTESVEGDRIALAM